MTEILTESFCERCGTRYTFESARPRARMKGVKVLSRGLKNFVLSDDTSMDEAMAAARSETDREATATQLDAFHKTFNFCMSCRQYTCPNCWNEVEARCLSCAPHLGHEVMPAPFPDMPVGLVVADPMTNGAIGTNGTNGSHATNGTNGAVHEVELIGVAESEALRRDDEIDAIARLDALTAPAVVAQVATSTADVVEPEPAAEIVAEPEAVAAEVVAEPEAAVVEPEAVAAIEAVEPEVAAVAEPDVVDVAESEAVAATEAVEPEVAAVSEPEVVVEPEVEVDDAAVAARLAAIGGAAIVADAITSDEAQAGQTFDQKLTSQTSGLLHRFRPGQSLDAELDAYEREQATAVDEATEAQAPMVEPEAVATDAVIGSEPAIAEPEPEVAAEPEPEIVAEVVAAAAVVASEPEPVATEPEPLAAEPEPVAAEPEPVAAEPEPVAAEPEPVAAVAEPEVTPPAPVVDVVPQPMWHMVAPEAPVDLPPVLVPPPPTTSIPSAASGANQPEPQWPTRPTNGTASRGLSFLGRPAAPQGGVEALWAESAREVVATPAASGKTVVGAVQPCVSCGLSLSATARFCRRCGTAQGG